MTTTPFTYSSADLITALQRAAERLGTCVLSGPAYETVGSIARQTFMARFGSWRAAVAAAGLKSPTLAGGQKRACDVCGASYSWDGGTKSRKTCSDACAQVLRERHWSRLRKTNATAHAHRGRARLVWLRAHGALQCDVCGVTVGRIEVHHLDHDWRNNALANLQALCVKCHKVAHS